MDWSETGKSFLIKDSQALIRLLSGYFRMNSFCSFVRQLTFYGFKKVNRSNLILEYQHVGFEKNKYKDISRIKRKRRLKKIQCKGFSLKKLSLEQDNLSKKTKTIKKLIGVYEHNIKEIEQANKAIREYTQTYEEKLEERMVRFVFCFTFLFFNYQMGIGKKICHLFKSEGPVEPIKCSRPFRRFLQAPSIDIQTIIDLSIKHFIMFKNSNDNKLDKFMNLVLVGNRNIIREEGFKEIFKIILEKVVIGKQQDKESTSRKLSRFEEIVSMIEFQSQAVQRKGIACDMDRDEVQEELENISTQSISFLGSLNERAESMNSRSIKLFGLNFSDNESLISFHD